MALLIVLLCIVLLILLIPLIFSLVYQYKLPAVYIGLPMMSALSVTHGFLPPHPFLTALVVQFKANMGLTLLYGLVVAIPAIVIAGPLFSMTLKKIPSSPSALFAGVDSTKGVPPGRFNSFASSLLPVFLLVITGLLQYFCPGNRPLLRFITEQPGLNNFLIIILNSNI